MAGQNMQALPENFVPGENDVICGRGRKAFNHIGNERFRQLVEKRLEEYSNAVAKLEKSYILSDIVCEVRQRSPDGGFVKKDTNSGRWYEVGDFLAREKTSQAFRDALHDQYKSSNTAKKKRRQAEQTQKLLMGQHGSTRSLCFEPRYGGIDHQDSSRSLQSGYGGLEHQASSRSLQCEPTYGGMSQHNMLVGGSNFEPSQDSLLGALDVELSASLAAQQNKQVLSINAQRSARSVVDFAPSRNNSGSGQAPVFNQSCPNFSWDPVQPDQLQQQQQLQDLMHHSSPHMFPPPSQPKQQQETFHPYSQRSMDDDMMDMDVEPAAVFPARQVSNGGGVDDMGSDSFGDDLYLSPIGDGSPRKLLNSLSRLAEDANVEVFQPSPMLDM